MRDYGDECRPLLTKLRARFHSLHISMLRVLGAATAVTPLPLATLDQMFSPSAASLTAKGGNRMGSLSMLRASQLAATVHDVPPLQVGLGGASGNRWHL